jgi:hypothetical protein
MRKILIQQSINETGFCLVTNDNIIYQKLNLIKKTTGIEIDKYYCNKPLKCVGNNKYSTPILVYIYDF